MNPTPFTKLTPTLKDSICSALSFLPIAVMIIPIIHTIEVLVIPSKDLVNASNNLVILTPFKLKTPRANSPKRTSIPSYKLVNTSLKNARGN